MISANRELRDDLHTNKSYCRQDSDDPPTPRLTLEKTIANESGKQASVQLTYIRNRRMFFQNGATSKTNPHFDSAGNNSSNSAY